MLLINKWAEGLTYDFGGKIKIEGSPSLKNKSEDGGNSKAMATVSGTNWFRDAAIESATGDG
jgi:hypothetical protein